MAIRKLASTGLTTDPRSNGLWDGKTSNYGLVPLAWTSLSGSQTNITISSIPTDYQGLRVVMCLRNTDSNFYTGHNFNINSDSGANYARWAMNNTGDGNNQVQWTGGFGQSTNTYFYSQGTSNTSQYYGVNVIDFINYSNTSQHKGYTHNYWQNTLTRSAASHYDRGFVQPNLASWGSTAAINSFTIFGNFASGSTVGVYGYKRAGQ
jgi:hypothetical protein